MRLYQEAITVGALLVPMWFLVSKTTAALKLTSESKPLIDIALSGFLFHLTAEETGVNEWYLTNSYAAMKHLHPHQNELSPFLVDHIWGTRRLDLS